MKYREYTGQSLSEIRRLHAESQDLRQARQNKKDKLALSRLNRAKAQRREA